MAVVKTKVGIDVVLPSRRDHRHQQVQYIILSLSLPRCLLDENVDPVGEHDDRTQGEHAGVKLRVIRVAALW